MLNPFQQKAAAARKFVPKAGLKSMKPKGISADVSNPGVPDAPPSSDSAHITTEVMKNPKHVFDSALNPSPSQNTDNSELGAKLVVDLVVAPVAAIHEAVPAPIEPVVEPVRKRFKVSTQKPVKRSSLLDVGYVGSESPGCSPPPPGSWSNSPVPGPAQVEARTVAVSVLPVELYGHNCPCELYTVYLRKQPDGLGLVLKNIEDRPVIVGFAPSFLTVQVESQARKVRLFDVIVGVNNVDIRTSVAAQSSKPGTKRSARVMRNGRSCREQASNFDKIVAALRESVTPNSNNVNSYASSSNHANNISISLSTIDTDIVCITLARPVSSSSSSASGTGS